MELEFFCKQEIALDLFEYWKKRRFEFFKKIGFQEENIRFNNHKKEDLSHYSSATTDIECLLPFGWKEVEGIAYRTNFDLSAHSKFSGKELSIYDDEKKCSYIPHVVECSVGIERIMFGLLCNAYHEDEINGEKRIVLRFNKNIAPYKAAIFPLTNNETEMAKKIYNNMSNKTDIQYDESGSIGKRYRRQDEIGTPYCITVDQESITNNTVTIRSRDTMLQERISIDKIEKYI
jgi:glycyl-tRNA synthetase